MVMKGSTQEMEPHHLVQSSVIPKAHPQQKQMIT